MAALTLGPAIASSSLEPYRSDGFLHLEQVKSSIAFPDKRLLQYDCGKLQRLATLLRDLIDDGHRALIFTQMTRVLDVLEQFLNIHGWRYLRLDGATKVEQRQFLTERFNSDSKIPVFILSTRSGGLGINLTGADTVIFYDSDWNPSMDKQCQDRCHRIGQTRDVHIYRFVSEHTIESNILRKATQKQILDNVVIQEGDFTTDYFHRLTVQDMIGNVDGISTDRALTENLPVNLQKALAAAEDAEDAAAANVAIKEANLDVEEFAERAASVPLSTVDDSQSQSPAVVAATEDGSSVPPELDAYASSPYSDDEPGHIDDYMIRFIENGYLND
jgi:helicase SWR1